MKKLLIVLCLLPLGTALDAGSNPRGFVHVMSRKMDVFYVKIDKEFLHSELEVYSEDGEKLLTQEVTRRKILIDFYYGQPGKFTILFKKGSLQEEFTFVKTEPCYEVEKPTQLVSVVQGI